MTLEDPLVPVESCYDGMDVYVLWSKTPPEPKRWILCTVQCAMGKTVRVSNPLYKIDAWRDVHEVRVRRSTLCPF